MVETIDDRDDELELLWEGEWDKLLERDALHELLGFVLSLPEEDGDGEALGLRLT